MKYLTISIQLALAVSVVCLLCSGVGGQSRNEGNGPDIRAALPPSDQIRGFKKSLHSDYFPGHAEISVQRPDGLILTITVVTSATEEETRKHCRNTIFTQTGFMPSGSPSGRKIGQEVWRSRYRDGGPPRGSFRLVTRDGRSMVVVDLKYTIREVRNGAPVLPLLSRADILMTERLALGCLNRLTKMGYTSRSTVKPSN